MNIGIDLGGTKIKVGIEDNGEIIHQKKAFLKEKDSFTSTIDQVFNLISPLTKHKVAGIGIGVPSVVDVERGIVYNVTNIPSWKKVDLKCILEKEYNLPVFVNNDVNCFTLGEYKFGLAKEYSSIVGMSIGTGLGSGIIIKNNLYTGNNCGAGEIGLLPYKDQNIEYYASGNFFKSFHGTTALEAYKAALTGNKQALDQWEEFGYHFGAAVQGVLYAYDPQAIVIGGSVSKAFEFFKSSMHKSFKDFIYPESIKRLRIFISENENIALLGAAALVDINN
ncbi:MAG: ROK family protein [Anditalea sp.]